MLVNRAIVVLAEHRPTGGTKFRKEIATAEGIADGDGLGTTRKKTVKTTVFVPLALQRLLDGNRAIVLAVTQFSRDEGDGSGRHRRDKFVIGAPALDEHEVRCTFIIRQKIGGDGAIFALHATDNSDRIGGRGNIREVVLNLSGGARASVNKQEGPALRAGRADGAGEDMCRSMMAQRDHAADDARRYGCVALVVAAQEKAMEARVELVEAERARRRGAFLEKVQPMRADRDKRRSGPGGQACEWGPADAWWGVYSGYPHSGR